MADEVNQQTAEHLCLPRLLEVCGRMRNYSTRRNATFHQNRRCDVQKHSDKCENKLQKREAFKAFGVDIFFSFLLSFVSNVEKEVGKKWHVNISSHNEDVKALKAGSSFSSWLCANLHSCVIGKAVFSSSHPPFFPCLTKSSSTQQRNSTVYTPSQTLKHYSLSSASPSLFNLSLLSFLLFSLSTPFSH